MTNRSPNYGEITKTILQMLTVGTVISAALLFPGLGLAWRKYKELAQYDRLYVPRNSRMG